MLRSMFLNIIPKQLKIEIAKEPKLIHADYMKLIEWCRARCTTLQHENLALVTARALQSAQWLQALMKTLSQMKILRVPLDGYDISLPRSNRQRLTVKIDRLVDEPIVVAAARVPPEAKNEVVETVQVRVAKVVEPDLPPLARIT